MSEEMQVVDPGSHPSNSECYLCGKTIYDKAWMAGTSGNRHIDCAKAKGPDGRRMMDVGEFTEDGGLVIRKGLGIPYEDNRMIDDQYSVKCSPTMAEFEALKKRVWNLEHPWINARTDGWHRWPEEKPEKSGVYLIYAPSAGQETVHYEHLQYSQGGWAYFSTELTHWRELPEPPKDGE